MEDSDDETGMRQEKRAEEALADVGNYRDIGEQELSAKQR